MAKKKRTMEESHGEHVDGMMASLHASLTKELGGDRVRSQEEIVNRMIGLPVPGLAIRWLLQQDVFPLGRITAITGQESSCKSSFMYELMRWHMTYGGMSLLLENETKDSPDIRDGLWDHNNEYLNERFRVVQTTDVDDWQAALTRGIDACQTYCDARGGPGRSIPMMYGIDSITAKMTELGASKVQKAGHSERGEGRSMALKLTEYFQYLPTKLIDWPFSVICIQHLKKGIDPRSGYPTRNKPGGRHIAFMETFEFEMTRGKDIKHVDDGGVHLMIETRKNSLGPARLKIDVIFRWWWQEDPETGMRIQKHVFDWDDASMHLLIKQAKDNKTAWKRIQAVVDLHPKISLRKVWSRELGIPEDSPASYAEAYRVIEEERPDILLELYKVLGIRQRRSFQKGVDYLAMANTQADTKAPKTPVRTLFSPPKVEAGSVVQELTEDEDLAGAIMETIREDEDTSTSAPVMELGEI